MTTAEQDLSSFTNFARQVISSGRSNVSIEELFDQWRAGTGARTLCLETFLDRAARLDKMGRTDAALDLLYDAIDETMRKGNFAELDSLLSRLDPKAFSIDLLLGMLTAALPARSRLAERAGFLKATKECLVERGEYEEGLLTGL